MGENCQDGAVRRRKHYRALVAVTAMAISAALCTVAAVPASASTAAAAASTGWTVQASGTSQHLYGVSCPTTSRCFAVGAGGTILQGNGSSWTSQPSGVTGTVHAVACPAMDLCLAVGSGGLLLRYDGVGWTKLPSPTIADLSRIACPSTALCFAAGGAGTIVRLTDSGNAAALVPSGTSQDLDAVSCASASFCVAVGDHGAITQYDGTSWRASPAVTGYLLHGVACPDTSFCLAVGEHGTVLGYHGAGWSPQPATSSTATINDVACPSASRCFAVDQKGTALAYDAGTWTSQPTGTGQDLRRIACPSTALCFAVGLSGTIARYDGPTWTSQPSGTTQPLSEVACASALMCFAAGEDGAVLRWDGQAWTRQGDVYVSGIACPSVSLCFAASGQGIFEFQNGTWAYVDLSSYVHGALFGVACASATYCVAVGTYDTIVAYNGVGWLPYSASTSRSKVLEWVSCAGAADCFALGFNAGQPFVQEAKSGVIQDLQPDYYTVNGIGCAAGLPCFVVGQAIWQYQNGSWRIDWDPANTSDLTAVSCPGSSQCFAVGGFASGTELDGPGLITRFDGSNWTTVQNPAASGLLGISCPSATFCMAVGNNGTTVAYAPAPGTPTLGAAPATIGSQPGFEFLGYADSGTVVSVYPEGSTTPLCTAQADANLGWSCQAAYQPSGSQAVVAVASNTTGQARSLPVSLTGK